MKTIIPIFFSVNDAYSPYLAVALRSIRENASESYTYNIHILTDDVTAENRRKLSVLATDNFRIEFHCLTSSLRQIPAARKLEQHRFGAFSSLTIYFRLFIPALFPQYNKAIYLDADLIVPGDISKLWEEPLGDNLIGACADYSIQHIAPFMKYIDQYVGVDHRNYINSGVLLLNMDRLREVDMAGKFLHWMRKYGLSCVAPDQDYINALCWNSIHYLDPCWDSMPSERISEFDDPQIIHFNLAAKPWLNESTPYEDLFWKYARRSGYYAEIHRRRDAFLRDRTAVEKYRSSIDSLIRMAAELSETKQSFRSLIDNRKELRLCS